jgi:D-arabinose 1-dehydrogenase-like Zn-dependent alcohol dehydrogenase
MNLLVKLSVKLREGVTNHKIDDRVGVLWVQTTYGRYEWCQGGNSLFTKTDRNSYRYSR